MLNLGGSTDVLVVAVVGWCLNSYFEQYLCDVLGLGKDSEAQRRGSDR